MYIWVCTVKPLGHWFRIPFGNILWIPLRVLSGLWGIGFRITLGGLSAFGVTPGLVVPARAVNVSRSKCEKQCFNCIRSSGVDH